MKRTSLYISLILTIVALTSASQTFGDSKNRGTSGGTGRGLTSSHNRPTVGQNSSVFGQNKGNQNGNKFGGINLNGNHNNQANSGSQQQGSSGMKTGGGFKLPNHGINLPQSGNRHNGQNSNQSNTHRPSNQPSNLKPKIGHIIHAANGSKTHAIGINAAQILKHKTPNVQVRSHVQNICGTAPKHLCNQPKFSWWVDVCYDHCHTNYGCWNVDQQYWDCWTPCNWQVVQCQQFSYFVGLNATYIPEMQAYGVQSMVAGSPAQVSGLLPGDLIVSVNGQTVFDPNLINNELVRGRLDMQVIREGFTDPIQLTVFPRLVQTVSF